MSSNSNLTNTRNLHDESYGEHKPAKDLDQPRVRGGKAGGASRDDDVQQASEREEHPRNELERQIMSIDRRHATARCDQRGTHCFKKDEVGTLVMLCHSRVEHLLRGLRGRKRCLCHFCRV